MRPDSVIVDEPKDVIGGLVRGMVTGTGVSIQHTGVFLCRCRIGDIGRLYWHKRFLEKRLY